MKFNPFRARYAHRTTQGCKDRRFRAHCRLCLSAKCRASLWYRWGNNSGSMNLAIKPTAADSKLSIDATFVIHIKRKYDFGIFDFEIVRKAAGHHDDGTINWISLCESISIYGEAAGFRLISPSQTIQPLNLMGIAVALTITRRSQRFIQKTQPHLNYSLLHVVVELHSRPSASSRAGSLHARLPPRVIHTPVLRTRRYSNLFR